MATARTVLSCALATGALALSLVSFEGGSAQASSGPADRARPAQGRREAAPSSGRSRLAGLASVPLGLPALLVEEPEERGLVEPSGPRRCAPFDPLAFVPPPGPGRQRCGEPHEVWRAPPTPGRTRCGTAVLD